MSTYIPISMLNDFSFCPYSIYLHNVYKGVEDDIYYAAPQVSGKHAHGSIDKPEKKTAKSRDLVGLEVCSEELNLCGKIDLYKDDTKLLIERKKKLKAIYQGHIWQLQAQYFCMLEMGYEVKGIAFYSMDDNKMLPQPLPTDNDKESLLKTISDLQDLSVLEHVQANPNKCKYCIYNSLCDKTEVSNVY